jgi:predicted Zn-dependent peptidase
MNPAFPASELDRIKSNLKRDLAVDMTVPQSIAQDKFRNALFKDHPMEDTLQKQKRSTGSRCKM